MDEQIILYQELQKVLPGITDRDTLDMAAQQMTLVENSHPELLSPSKFFLQYLPTDHEASFHICVIGYDTHFLFHACELLYKKTSVYWIPDIGSYLTENDEVFDFILFSAETVEYLLEHYDIVRVLEKKTRKDGCWVSEIPPNISNEKMYDFCVKNGMRIAQLDSEGYFIAQKVTLCHVPVDVFSKYKTVYVVCPQCIKTGGPELLHQLVYWINTFSGNARVAYYVKDESLCLCHPELASYVAGHICRYDEIEDSPENAIVIPEGWPRLATENRRAVQYFWWLSVDNYFCCMDDANDAYDTLSKIDKQTYLHLFQSEYAKDFLLKNRIKKEKLIHLGDYINQAYLDNTKEALKQKKEDIVLYNPKKGKEFVEHLKERAPDLNWKAIEKMTTTEVGELMRKAKVYIDFGNHPGKDRIPREAAISGCIVITGRQGSAAYDEDVPIPSQYKIDENAGEEVYEKVISAIREAISNYDSEIQEFESYRAHILAEKEEFLDDLKHIFFE